MDDLEQIIGEAQAQQPRARFRQGCVNPCYFVHREVETDQVGEAAAERGHLVGAEVLELFALQLKLSLAVLLGHEF